MQERLVEGLRVAAILWGGIAVVVSSHIIDYINSGVCVLLLMCVFWFI